MEAPQTIQEVLSSPSVVRWIRRWLRENENSSRAALARGLCEAFDLRDLTGRLRLSGVHKALRVLSSRGLFELPPPRRPPRRRWSARRLDGPVLKPVGVPGSVEAIKDLRLVEVTAHDDDLFRIWNELMLREHPLEDCRLVGRQLRYLVASEYGYLGGLGFGSCALRLSAREAWIGWDEATRKRERDRVINLTRFLIRPMLLCENLASRVLSLCLSRVAADFSERYGFEPYLVETFVDAEHYGAGSGAAGGCFRAANWEFVGMTAGRGRRGAKRPAKSRKATYLYPLRPDWRRAMGIERETVPSVSVEESLANETWVEEEFGGVHFGHRAMEDRLRRIVRRKARHPGSPYTECFDGNRHELKGAYRFMRSKREEITPEAILAGHRERTIGRMKGEKRVLLVQDSTDLDFSDRLECNGLGMIGTNQTGASSLGLRMHSTLALTAEGLPLGVLRTERYPPKLAAMQARRQGENAARAEPASSERPKESHRWLRSFEEAASVLPLLADPSEPVQTELILVGDRESDMFSLFELRRRRSRSVHLLVRAKHNRRLEGELPKLFDHLKVLPAMAEAEIEVPRQRQSKGKKSLPGRVALPARVARVEVKWKKVSISAPATPETRGAPAAESYAIELREPEAPRGAKPIHWVLLTTLPIASRKQALRCVQSYALRWRIEEWHRLLKSGCRIESHQYHTAKRLERAITIDAVIAWRVMLLTLLGREAPELPCEVVFSTWETKLLRAMQPKYAPETITNDDGLTIGTACLIIGRLGGALRRNSREPPGHQKMVRGLSRFTDIYYGYSLGGAGG